MSSDRQTGKVELTSALVKNAACLSHVLRFARKVKRSINRCPDKKASIVQEHRKNALESARAACGAEFQIARFAISVLCDLIGQGWDISVSKGRLYALRPERINDPLSEKERVRQSLMLARNEQLMQPSVQSFVKSMETLRLGPNGWCSVLSLMRNGEELAASLTAARASGDETSCAEALRSVVRPYLQFITENARCDWTGLRLADIWRYFRYTWLTPSHSTPGRNMMVLIRDAAVEPHPVIGIAALSSSIVQQRKRDEWIGWTAKSVLEEIDSNPSLPLAEWLLSSLSRLLSGIYHADLVDELILSSDEIDRPTPDTIDRLHVFCQTERTRHQVHVRAAKHKKDQSNGDWGVLCETPLFRSKRAGTLASLLGIRMAFQSTGFDQASESQLEQVSAHTKFRTAVGQLVRQIKASRVGVNMMDVSVAGAIAPYNPLLGGKLVSMLLASSEVRLNYTRRYEATPSVIASGMSGRAVLRKPDLVLLCTTGLFGHGSSQYNRITIPAASVGGGTGNIRFTHLNDVTAYSTFHISQSTLSEMRVYAEQHLQGSDVHGIFGEGVNPKMRRIRESLEHIGFRPDEILQTASPRSIYVIALADNFRDVLLARCELPSYLVPDDLPRETTELIADYWRRRWLAHRICSDKVIACVAANCSDGSSKHGGVVRLPQSTDDALSVFDTTMFEADSMTPYESSR